MPKFPDGFGREYRHAVFARTTSMASSRLAVVLIDEAYTQRSTIVYAGYRYLREEAELHGRDVERARDELVEAGLLRWQPTGTGRGARTEWELVLNDRATPVIEVERTTGLHRSFQKPQTSGETSGLHRARSVPHYLNPVATVGTEAGGVGNGTYPTDEQIRVLAAEAGDDDIPD